MSKHTRRDFLRRTGCAGLGAVALSAGFKKLGLMNMYAQEGVRARSAASAASVAPGYQALVCIFLSGGNDSNNMVIPTSTAGYGAYSGVRASSGLAIPLANVLPLNPVSFGTFGLHPSMPELQSLFNLNKLGIVANCGTLVQPTTRATYQNGSARRPYQLFSHSDQVEIWQSGRPDVRTQTGWGGRTADRVVYLNSSSGFPVVTSVTGSAIFGQGLSTRPIAIQSGTPLNQVLVLSGFNTSPEATARHNSFDYLRTVDNTATLIAAASDSTDEAVSIMQSLTVDPTLATTFPNSGLGQQLKQIAKVIKLNQTTPALNLNRQIFFASIGGFDTHQNQLGAHVALYTQLSQAMKAFYDSTVELGLADKVTTFTMSDFGRTLAPSGSGGGAGCDHAWGSHVLVMGDSVRGGNIYGVNGSNGTPFPTLQLAGPDDTDNRGRFIPTVAMDQYAATLGKWFGLQASDNPIVFPTLSNFTVSDLGFMM